MLLRRIKATGRILGYLILIGSILTLIYFVGWQLPIWQTSEIKLGTQEEKDRIEFQDKFRKTNLQILAGLGLILGLYLTWRRTESMVRAVQVTEERQITERLALCQL